jgi:type IV pilus assembly protein PilN
MFVPEINFLKDRNPDTNGMNFSDEFGGEATNNTPLLLAAAIPLAILVLSAGSYVYFGGQLAGKQNDLKTLTADVSGLEGQLTGLRNQQKELQENRDQVQAVIGLYDLSRPWSSVVEDIRRKVPQGVWLEDFTTTAGADASKEDVLKVKGKALQFQQVANFKLTLEQSPFITRVDLGEANLNEANKDQPATVSYSMDVNLRKQKLDEVRKTLEETNSVGLLEKLRRLQQESIR